MQKASRTDRAMNVADANDCYPLMTLAYFIKIEVVIYDEVQHPRQEAR